VDGGLSWSGTTLDVRGCLRDVDFVDAFNGWAVGCDYGPDGDWHWGTVLHTVDGGLTWQTSLETNADLDTVAFADGLHGWVGGEDGAIARTTDGGTTWEALDTTTASTVHKVVAADQLQVWAAGAGGTILRTDDGGGPSLGTLGEEADEPGSQGRLMLSDVKD